LPTRFRNDDGTITWRFDEAVPDAPKAGSPAHPYAEGREIIILHSAETRGSYSRFRRLEYLFSLKRKLLPPGGGGLLKVEFPFIRFCRRVLRKLHPSEPFNSRRRITRIDPPTVRNNRHFLNSRFSVTREKCVTYGATCTAAKSASALINACTWAAGVISHTAKCRGRYCVWFQRSRRQSSRTRNFRHDCMIDEIVAIDASIIPRATRNQRVIHASTLRNADEPVPKLCRVRRTRVERSHRAVHVGIEKR